MSTWSSPTPVSPLTPNSGPSQPEREALADLRDVEGGDDHFVELAGCPAVVREIAFTDVGTGFGLYQLQAQLLVQVGGGVADLVTLSGTCAGDQLQFVPVLRSIVESVQCDANG